MGSSPTKEFTVRHPIVVTLGAVGALGLVVGADLVVSQVAERNMSARLPCGAAVDIVGFPVTPQIVNGTLGHLSLSADQVLVRDRSVSVDASLTGVRTRDDLKAEHASIDVTVPWGETEGLVQGTAGASITGMRAVDDLLALDFTMTTALGDVSATLLASARVESGALVVSPEFVQLGPQQISVERLADNDRLREIVAPRTIAPSLPATLALTEAKVAAEGLVVTAEASEVTLDEMRPTNGGSSRCEQ
jgi:hypothetical protein